MRQTAYRVVEIAALQAFTASPTGFTENRPQNTSVYNSSPPLESVRGVYSTSYSELSAH
ncbi:MULTISPECIES: hypothetical protein [Brasilonema]|uniref:hypothetical protein n=1 Tax=Brasilonema TaxID=383614 RepID=UPI00145CE7BA|nr:MULTISPECIES: hypothetical protein [Brasilonema]